MKKMLSLVLCLAICLCNIALADFTPTPRRPHPLF